MNISEQIENDIKGLKKKRYSDDKRQQYNLIASRLGRYFKQTKTEKFTSSLIMSFFEGGFYPLSTRRRHAKNIIDTLKFRGLVIDGNITKNRKQCRVYQLKSDDKKSYMALMKSNGYTQINYFKWYCDSEGIPRKKKVATSRLNAFPVDKDGDSVDDWDFSELRQTISRAKQGVNSFGSKSIAIEKGSYAIKCFLVC